VSYRRILAAVDDSAAGLEAARVAVDLAVGSGAVLRAITVLHDHQLQAVMGGEAARTLHELEAGARSLLAWVGDLAARRGLPFEAVERSGEPFRKILDEADTWRAEVIVIGRSDRRGPSSPYLGSETAHVLEFAEVPVLVVPRRRG
jgi:nucleotide-binding universal stress UspA family protein